MKRIQGFTMVELLMTMGLISALAGALFTFTHMSSRMVARNLATNHTHADTRISSLTLLNELKSSASAFRLISAETFEDVASARTQDMDDLTGEYIGTRSNGVRFRRLLGGPLRLSADVLPEDMKLSFDFGGIKPEAGDKLVLPLISREFDIASVNGSTVTLKERLGYTLKSEAPNCVTGYLYRRSAFTVLGNELRYHENFNGSAKGYYKVVRRGITSGFPFSLLYPKSEFTSSDHLSLRVSMEFTDLGYS